MGMKISGVEQPDVERARHSFRGQVRVFVELELQWALMR